MGWHKTRSLTQASWTDVTCLVSHKSRDLEAWSHLCNWVCHIRSHISSLKGKKNDFTVNLSKAYWGTNIRWQCDGWIAEGCSDAWAWRAGVPTPPHPAGPGWGSMSWIPSVQSQREAGLYYWGCGFSSHILTSGRIQVTSFIPFGLCSESQHLGSLALLGGLAASNWCSQCQGWSAFSG